MDAPDEGDRQSSSSESPAEPAPAMAHPLSPVFYREGLAPIREASPFTLRINGRDRAVTLPPEITLLEALRNHLGLTGAKQGCDHGQCGSCTVLINGRRIYACLTLAIMHTGHEITTVEGIAAAECLHPLQQAFITHDAFQCGYCTPGQLCSGIGLLHEDPRPDDETIRQGMSGNLCRCGAYPQIVEAIRSVRDRTSPTT